MALSSLVCLPGSGAQSQEMGGVQPPPTRGEAGHLPLTLPACSPGALGVCGGLMNSLSGTLCLWGIKHTRVMTL